MSDRPQKIERTVDQYLANFRLAMMALVPIYQYIGMPWQNPDAYDEWEDIAFLLYKHIVANELVDEDEREKFFPLIGYDLTTVNYREHSYIHLKDEPNLAFVGFVTESRPFEMCSVARIGRNGTRLSGETIEYKGASFALFLRPQR